MGRRRETRPRPHCYAKAIPGLASHHLRDFGRCFSPIWALVFLVRKMSNLDQVMSEDPCRTSWFIGQIGPMAHPAWDLQGSQRLRRVGAWSSSQMPSSKIVPQTHLPLLTAPRHSKSLGQVEGRIRTKLAVFFLSHFSSLRRNSNPCGAKCSFPTQQKSFPSCGPMNSSGELNAIPNLRPSN